MVTTPASRQWALALLFMLISWLAQAAEFTATTDRDNLAEGESVTLTVRFAGQVLGELDFSSLEHDFDILSSQRQSQLSFGSGANRSRTEWRLTLMPRHSGSLVIPSLHFRGHVSDAILINVSDQPPSADSEQDFFVDMTVDTPQPRVDEQVIVSYKIHSAQPLVSLAAAELDVPGARVVQVYETQYQRTISGTNYGVVEVRYALFPERSGQLAIPALQFRGEVADGNDPFGGFGRSLFGRAKPVRLTSPAQTLLVLPIPEQISATQWLPSKGLSLAQRWSRELDQLVVGEPVTRSVIISAQGLQGAQLPALTDTAPSEDVKVYPDQPRIEDQTSGSGVIGTRIESVAIVPTRAGTLRLPALRVQWWDTVAGALRETQLDAVTLEVAPAPTSASPATSETAAASEAPRQERATNQQPYWLWLSFAANILLALLVTAFAVLLWRRRQPATLGPAVPAAVEDPQRLEAAAFKRIRQSTPQQLAELREAILQWAQLHWPEHTVKTLADIVIVSGEPQLARYFDRLDSSLYRDPAAAQPHEVALNATDLAALATLLASVRTSQTSNRKRGKAATTLPPLYPKR